MEQDGEDVGDRAVADAFDAATGSGDVSALLAVPAPDASPCVLGSPSSRAGFLDWTP